ncbi:hypothetical protein ACFLRQ_00135 [Bacteroidota bacterium]
MEKVSLYVKKILALILSAFILIVLIEFLGIEKIIFQVLISAVTFLLYAYLDFRITGEKPRFLFGMNQSDTFLNKKGGFWNLFKWIVNLLGFLYDLVIWSVWGVYLVFVLFVDFLLLIKTIVFWIIHALIWFIRQLFPPFIFLFKMVMHYLINWSWWIYQLAFRNMKISVNKNFFFISLWGIIPALFVVFLFYAISQLVGIEELVAISAVFALIPLVWSFGEISALRFEEREKDEYSSVSAKFNNGFEAVKSVLFYLVIIIILIAAEIILNLMGWIPNLSLSLLGITLNLNMAISFLLVFLAIIIAFAGCILPTHILYKPEHENDLNSSLGFLQTIAKKFLRYTVSAIPSSFFGGLLLVFPIVVILLTYTITDSVKNSVLQNQIVRMDEKASSMEVLDAYRTEIKIDRLKTYKDLPLMAPQNFEDLRGSTGQLNKMKYEKTSAEEQLETRKAAFDQELGLISAQINSARAGGAEATVIDKINSLTANRLDIEEEYLNWESNQKECIAFLGADIKELKSIRVQMPIFYFFIGILFAVFGGILLALYVSYMGNVYFELYNMREDGKPTYWCQTVTELKNKDPNQPLLGFTFLAILSVLAYLIASGVISF